MLKKIKKMEQMNPGRVGEAKGISLPWIPNESAYPGTERKEAGANNHEKLQFEFQITSSLV